MISCSWQRHTLHLQGKLRKLNYLFYHLKNFFNSDLLEKLYPSLYESVLSHGIIHWGKTAHAKQIKVLQNKLVRSIMNLDRMSSERELYSRFKYGKFENVYKKCLLMFIAKHKAYFGIHDTIAYCGLRVPGMA